jgi:hypothetical protein
MALQATSWVINTCEKPKPSQYSQGGHSHSAERDTDAVDGMCASGSVGDNIRHCFTAICTWWTHRLFYIVGERAVFNKYNAKEPKLIQKQRSQSTISNKGPLAAD